MAERFGPTIEAWCRAFVTCTDAERKLAPPPPPDAGVETSWEREPEARRPTPGRPGAWRVVARSPKTPRDLTPPAARVRLLATLLHHELQAAELFAWAILAFPGTPRAFRAGMLGLCRSELEHLARYRAHLERLGGRVGEHPVRDWFWERALGCADALAFVAFLGLGLEGANLEHTARFARAFRAAGDEDGARTLESIEAEEVAHVAFAARWFERLGGAPLDWERWCAALPAPLTPALFRGRPLNRAARTRAGLGGALLDALERAPAAEVPR